MKVNKQQGFGTIEILLILVIVGVVGFVGWYVVSRQNPQPSHSWSYSSSGDSYDANGTLFKEDPAPSKDHLTVKIDANKVLHINIAFKQDSKAYKLKYNGISVIHEKLNGVTTQTIDFQVQKIEQQDQSDSNSGLDAAMGSPKEFSSSFKPGHYLVKVTIDTRDSVTNKSLGTNILNDSLNYQ